MAGEREISATVVYELLQQVRVDVKEQHARLRVDINESLCRIEAAVRENSKRGSEHHGRITAVETKLDNLKELSKGRIVTLTALFSTAAVIMWQLVLRVWDKFSS